MTAPWPNWCFPHNPNPKRHFAPASCQRCLTQHNTWSRSHSQIPLQGPVPCQQQLGQPVWNSCSQFDFFSTQLLLPLTSTIHHGCFSDRKCSGASSTSSRHSRSRDTTDSTSRSGAAGTSHSRQETQQTSVLGRDVPMSSQVQRREQWQRGCTSAVPTRQESRRMGDQGKDVSKKTLS